MALMAGEAVGGFPVGERTIVLMSKVVRWVPNFVDGVVASSFSPDSWSH